MNLLFSYNNLSKFVKLNHISSKSCSICTTSYKFKIAELAKSKEIQIDVPWGHVAGKWYGPENIRPVLMLHGWQDNAGTFNTLIPKLPQHLSYLSIDMPGVGLSTRLPHGIIYTTMSYLNIINLVRRHFNWDQISFCCHSMGAIHAHLYCMLYPKYCEFLVAIDDILKPRMDAIEEKIEYLRKLGDDFLALDQLNRTGKEPPTYTFNECKKRLMEESVLTDEAVLHLMKRGVLPSKADPNRYYFSRDVRLKIMEYPPQKIPDNIQYKLMEEMKVPFLFIKANKTEQFDGIERYRKPLDILTANNPKFQWTTVVGPHHVHITDPLVVSECISKFINKHRPPIEAQKNAVQN